MAGGEMGKTNENPGIAPTLRHSVSGGAEKEKRPWNEKTMLNLLTEALGKVCGPEAGDCEDLLRDVQLALSRCLGLQSNKIEVEVRGGIVHLRGQANSEFEKFLAEDAVRWTPCMVDVANELSVSSAPAN